MNAKRIPGFTADQSLQPARTYYRSGASFAPGVEGVIPAIPACRNCDYILENCEKHGWRPRALCNFCATGFCYEDPPAPNPFPDPFPPLPRL